MKFYINFSESNKEQIEFDRTVNLEIKSQS